jgi:hypothetical protein
MAYLFFSNITLNKVLQQLSCCAKHTSTPTSSHTSVACAIGPSVNPLQNRETQHVNTVLQCMYQFFEQPNMKGNHP